MHEQNDAIIGELRDRGRVFVADIKLYLGIDGWNRELLGLEWLTDAGHCCVAEPKRRKNPPIIFHILVPTNPPCGSETWIRSGFRCHTLEMNSKQGTISSPVVV